MFVYVGRKFNWGDRFYVVYLFEVLVFFQKVEEDFNKINGENYMHYRNR